MEMCLECGVRPPVIMGTRCFAHTPWNEKMQIKKAWKALSPDEFRAIKREYAEQRAELLARYHR